MKVEYRNLPYDAGKVSTVSIGVGSLHESRPQEIKDLSSPLHNDQHNDHSSVHTVIQGLLALFWMVLQSGVET